MKSYSLELVQRKTGSGVLGKLAAVALVGAGAYVGYKNLKKDKKQKSLSEAQGESTYDAQAHEGEDFTARILKAAKRIIK
ncbi:hypothetical protein SAMN02745823_02075 [Sporobacter termitidis DSM 10068]|uniref:Uncharacterized protein n=1 Tax=Sporobacter termitidis DSM 10068 TaxID=1123282 RepID=A0A1M5XVD5_9FIRM|nr:hypothetical protein [Sporobacter termitidis]SHI03805.1 hypothetical protein SAMN02745823_02075 [Sporobacter termitidis DSM 10068]